MRGWGKWWEGSVAARPPVATVDADDIARLLQNVQDVVANRFERFGSSRRRG
jgi:hypothetical protein